VLSRAAIYALPAKYEPFGLSVLEAALSGCALVLGDIPSLRENWNGAAVFVNPNDTDELQNQLKRLIADRVWRKELAERALERSKAFTVERMTDAYVSVYRELRGNFLRRNEQAGRWSIANRHVLPVANLRLESR
jgi:glycosyltransferase involved in cell wall biosynthesis